MRTPKITTYTVIALAALMLALPPLAGCLRGEISPRTQEQFDQQTTERAALEHKIEQSEDALRALMQRPLTPETEPIFQDTLAEYRALLEQERKLRDRELDTLEQAGDEEVRPIQGPVTGNPLLDTLIIAGGALVANGAKKYLQSDRYREHMNNALRYAVKFKLLQAAEAVSKAGGVKHTTDDPDQLVRNAAHLAKEQGDPAKAATLQAVVPPAPAK